MKINNKSKIKGPFGSKLRYTTPRVRLTDVYTSVFLSVRSIFRLPVCHSSCQDNLVLSTAFIMQIVKRK